MDTRLVTPMPHLWYMDDLKGFTDSYENMCKLANLIESKSHDIGMELTGSQPA